MFLTIITFLAVLSLIVFAHEFGHYWTARKIGVKAKEFGFGMPPRAVGWYKSKEGKWKKVIGGKEVDDAADTIWSLNWLPLGGFVQLGEDDESSTDPDHFVNKKIWQKSVVLAAGVSMNIVLAMVLISIGFMIGLPQNLDNIGSRAQISNRKIQIVEILPDSPAANAELEIGDVIVSVDDNFFENHAELLAYLDAHVGEELAYDLKRRGEDLERKITPTAREDTGRAGIGVAIAETGIVSYPWYLSLFEGIKATIFLTWAIVIAFYEMLKGLIVGNGMSAEVAGPVGIAVLTGEVARMGIIYLLQFTALLSVNLAIINIFPFPALDGGRLLFLAIEKIKGSPVKRQVEGAIHYVGFALLMGLILLVTFKDVAKHVNFGSLWDKIF